jgi:hypothetical protein
MKEKKLVEFFQKNLSKKQLNWSPKVTKGPRQWPGI